MKKAIIILLTTSLAISLFSGCATNEKKDKVVTPRSNDRFRTIQENRNNQEITVVCHNCRAQFKISRNAMKSGAVVKCPICNHLYRL